MLYLSKYTFNRSDASELNALVTTAKIPDGVEIIGNYTIIDIAEGFTIFRAKDHKSILDYTSQFRRFISNFSVVPIESVKEPLFRS